MRNRERARSNWSVESYYFFSRWCADHYFIMVIGVIIASAQVPCQVYVEKTTAAIIKIVAMSRFLLCTHGNTTTQSIKVIIRMRISEWLVSWCGWDRRFLACILSISALRCFLRRPQVLMISLSKITKKKNRQFIMSSSYVYRIISGEIKND